jgi:hypothetical protein
MSFQLTKFRNCNDIILLHGKRFQISITDICSPEVKTMSSERKVTIRSPGRDMTPEYTLSRGISMR